MLGAIERESSFKKKLVIIHTWGTKKSVTPIVKGAKEGKKKKEDAARKSGHVGKKGADHQAPGLKRSES